MRVLVTGAGGFLGSQVVRELAGRGHEVYGADARFSGELPTGVRGVALDLRDAQAVREALARIRPECAIHLAWYTVHGRYWTAPENLDCVSWSMGLARALAEVGCRRLVVAGTCAEYDWKHDRLQEDVTPCAPTTLYGIAKDATRRVLEGFCGASGMTFAWGRIFLLYGPYEHPDRLVAHIAGGLVRGERPRCGNATLQRDFLHVSDVASAFCALAESQVEGPVNIASGVAVSIRQVADRLAVMAGRPGGVDFGASPAKMGEPPLLVADVKRLTQEVGWKPSKTLDGGLAETLDWWKARAAKESVA
ncbi:MAG: NAD(P)-dependent oxidoreductase [Elusimicrobiota bacterium]